MPQLHNFRGAKNGRSEAGKVERKDQEGREKEKLQEQEKGTLKSSPTVLCGLPPSLHLPTIQKFLPFQIRVAPHLCVVTGVIWSSKD